MKEQELLERLDILEEKVDRLITLVEKAEGAWFFAKLFGAAVVGVAAIWTFFIDHFKAIK